MNQIIEIRLKSKIEQQQQEIEELKAALTFEKHSHQYNYEQLEEADEEIKELKQEIESLTNLKKTLEEANHGMQRKIEEQQQEIEAISKQKTHITQLYKIYIDKYDWALNEIAKLRNSR